MFRNFIRVITIVALVFACATANASTEGAKSFIQRLGGSTLSIVSTDSLNDKQKETELNNLFQKSVDIDWIAKFVMGSYWNTATDTQKNEYLVLYRKFLINSYVPKFRTYTDEKIEVLDSIKEDSGEFLVQTAILTSKRVNIRVDYKVRQGKDGSYQIFDVIAEGISLITTQRSDFGSILSRQGTEKLIALLKKKVAI